MNLSRSAILWRRWLLALCSFAFVELGVTCWMQVGHFATIPGFVQAGFVGESTSETPTRTPFVHKLTLARKGAAHRAGLRDGDIVDLRLLSPADRYRLTTRWSWRGEQLVLPVVRGHTLRRVQLTAQWYPMTWDVASANIGLFVMLVFAAAIAWLRPQLWEARLLALLLVLYNIGLTFEPQNWVSPWPALDATLAALSAIPYFFGAAMFAGYAAIFARPLNMTRRLFTGVAYVAAGVGAVYSAVAYAGVWTATLDPLGHWYGSSAAQSLFGGINEFGDVLPFVLPLLCVLAAWLQTRGVERTRLSWASIPLALLYAATVLVVVVGDLNGVPRWSIYAVNSAMLLSPLGLVYSLLNRRLLDISFVLNRAAAFTAVSVIIVGAFVLVEWALGEWFSSASHATNLAISATLALALGLSIRAIHSRVDRALDAIFFRKRHEDEQAIRTLGREAAYITDPQILLSRVIAVLEEHADASDVQILLDDATGHYGAVSENDPAIVRLRASREVLDLHRVKSAIAGEFAYPMLARGRVVGVLVLGLKRSGEAYAPDESDAIAQLSHDAGAALDHLFAVRGDHAMGSETVEQLTRRILQNVLELRASLPGATVERAEAQ